MSVLSVEGTWDGEYHLIELEYKHPSTGEEIALYLSWEEAEFIIRRLTEILTNT